MAKIVQIIDRDASDTLSKVIEEVDSYGHAVPEIWKNDLRSEFDKEQAVNSKFVCMFVSGLSTSVCLCVHINLFTSTIIFHFSLSRSLSLGLFYMHHSYRKEKQQMECSDHSLRYTITLSFDISTDYVSNLTALAVYVRSPAAYEALKSFNLLQLPSKATLQAHTGAFLDEPGRKVLHVCHICVLCYG